MAPTVETIETLLQRAERHAHRGEHAEAAQVYRTILDRQPEHREAQIGYIRALIADGRAQAAEEYLRPILEENEDGYLLAELGRVYYAQGRYSEAVEALRRATELLPEEGMIKANYGFALWESGERTKALDVLQEALPSVQQDARVAANMGQIFLQLGMWNEAISSLERYLLDYPADLDHRILLAYALNQAGWREEAETVLEEILLLEPDHTRAKELLETIRSQPEQEAAQETAPLIDFESLEENLSELDDLDLDFEALSADLAEETVSEESSQEPSEGPSRPVVGAPEGVILQGIENPARAQQEVPDPFAALDELGIVGDLDQRAAERQRLEEKLAPMIEKNDLDGAIAFLEGERSRSQAPAEVLNILGKLLVERGDYESAADVFREAVELDPLHSQARSNLGVLLWQLGEFQEAIDVLRSAVEIDSEDMDGRINLALICHQVGLYEEAVPLYEQYLERFPEDTEIRMELAHCYEKLGETERAIEELDTVLLLDPDNETAQQRYQELTHPGSEGPSAASS
ncbi:MAG: hypothetical protein KatS3mg115_1695 [Candidatus Poribacteria bacterium]|nr:MAG: hypothetical protein KatS3mg115_1695 [Candidatus Poribacteria bacterium]